MKKKTCNYCGKNNKISAKFCAKCGNSFDSSSSNDNDSPSEKSKSSINASTVKKNPFKNPTLLILFTLCIVALIAIIVLCTRPKITSISAEYNGSKKAGTVLDSNNKDFVVTGLTSKGEKIDLKDWSIEKPVTLEKDKTSTVTITSHNNTVTLSIVCSTSEITDLEVTYNGSTKAGTLISNNSDFTVLDIHKNGKKTTCKKWKVKTELPLVADCASNVTIVCGNIEKPISIQCSTKTPTGLQATYSGKTEAGVELNKDNSGIEVSAVYKDGSTESVTGFSITNPTTLVAGETSSITITYQNQQCTLDVTCTTLSEAQFKEQCQNISYDDLARNPDNYESTKVKFTGKVVQVIGGDDSIGALRVNVTKRKYGYDDTVYVMYVPDPSNRVLEDDIISFYGTSTGLYSYTTVLGAQLTIPSVLAVYIDIN